MVGKKRIKNLKKGKKRHRLPKLCLKLHRLGRLASNWCGKREMKKVRCHFARDGDRFIVELGYVTDNIFNILLTD